MVFHSLTKWVFKQIFHYMFSPRGSRINYLATAVALTTLFNIFGSVLQIKPLQGFSEYAKPKWI